MEAIGVFPEGMANTTPRIVQFKGRAAWLGCSVGTFSFFIILAFLSLILIIIGTCHVLPAHPRDLTTSSNNT